MIHDKLVKIQSALVAPKGQINSFGKYKYRSCEDILEALKPLLKEHNVVLTLSDSIEVVGSRYYVKASATLSDAEGIASVTAYAREEEDKKGMDGSQITGAASSYARKYALNGLFCIDDSKDSDATNDHKKTKVTDEDLKAQGNELARIKGEIFTFCGGDLNNVRAEAAKLGIKDASKMTLAEAKRFLGHLVDSKANS